MAVKLSEFLSESFLGYTGSQGTQGTQGIQGTTGAQGIQGRQGTTGSQGIQGTTGAQGIQGTTGSQGTQGIQGTTGSQGTTGAQGIQGIQGTTGSQGIQGRQGIQGIQGISGVDGAQGAQGIQGIQGRQGTQGIQGTTGDIGFTGSQGIQGIQGPQGTQGIQGSTGTQGSQGVQGIQGIQGVQGIQGIQGIQGRQGITGNQGIQGTQGIQGIQGVQGFRGALQWTSKSALYTAVNEDAIVANTSAGSFTINLPAAPAAGYTVVIVDGNGTFATNPLTVARNGSTIESLTDDIVLNIANIRVDFVYNGSTWQVYTTVGQIGFTGSQGVQGTQGIQGIQGRQGIQGTQGIQGIQGITGPGNIITAATDAATTTLYPVMVGALDSAQTAKGASGFVYNASTNRITVSGDIAVTGGDITTSATTANIFNTTATTVSFANAATTSTLGYTGTSTSTTNLSTGAAASGSTKTINIGTGGAAGSTTTINIGDADGGSTVVNSPSLIVPGNISVGANILATTGPILTLGTLAAGGTGYMNGTHTNQALTGGTGAYMLGTVTVALGVVTGITLTWGGHRYTAGDSLTVGSLSTTLATTATSGTGTVATLTFAAQAAAPFQVGSQIIVAGVTPTGYNGTFTVTACTTTTVSYANTTTGAQTVAGTVKMGAALTNSTIPVSTIQGSDIYVSSAISANIGSRIRLEYNNTAPAAGTEYGAIAFGSRDSSAFGSGDLALIRGVAVGTSGGSDIQFWTAGSAEAPALSAVVTSAGNFRMYNAAGTFYSELNNSPTNNRTLIIPDVAGTILISQAAATAGYFDTSTTAPSATTRLNYNGNFYVNNLIASAEVTAYSDAKLKTNIKDIENPLEKVLKLRGVTFNRIDLEDHDRVYVGVIAQEIEKILPEVITTVEDGTKTVAYGNIVALLIEAIKELAKKMEDRP